MNKSNPFLWGFCRKECRMESNPNTGYYLHYVFVIITIALILILGFSQIISVYSSGISGTIKTVGYSISKGITIPRLFPISAISFILFLFFVYALISDLVLSLDR